MEVWFSQSSLPPQVSSEILRTPISKVGVSPDILVWKHSSSGNYNVKCAYNLLHRDSSSFNEIHSRQHNVHTASWNVVWKVGVPLKVCNFVWRLLHDSLPTRLALKSRGIPVDSGCPLCNEGDESTSHLFLGCTFARAVWHGLAIHTSALPHTSIQSWIRALLFKHKRLDQNSTYCLQAIFTTLWTIWTHRNSVIREGKHPNPIEVVLTSRSLLCRYKDAFSSCSNPPHSRAIQARP